MAYREENIIRPVSHSSFIMLAARTIQTHLAEKSPSDRILYTFLVFVLPAAPVHPPKYGPLHAAKNENHLSPLSGPRSPSALNPLTRRPSHHHPTPPLHLFEAIYYREMASGHYKHNQALREFIVMCVVSLLAFTSFSLALMYNRRAVHAATTDPPSTTTTTTFEGSALQKGKCFASLHRRRTLFLRLRVQTQPR